MLIELFSKLEDFPAKRLEFGLIALALALNLGLYLYLGIKVMDDSQQYLELAEQFPFGFTPAQRGFWYSGYIVILWAFLKSGVGLGGVILLQVSISILTVVTIFRTTCSINQSKFSGLVAALLYLGWIEISQWNMYVLTESLFTSCCLLLAIASVSWVPKNLLKLMPVFALTILLRPMGITFLMSILLILTLRYWRLLFSHQKLRITTISLIMLITGVIMTLLVEASPDLTFYYSRGEVVYGASLLDHTKTNDWLVVDPSSVIYPPESGPKLLQFARYAVYNPLFLGELFFKKLLFFIFHIKPYYSIAHNLLIAFSLPLIYVAWLIGIRKTPKWEPLKVFSILFFSLNATMVSLSIEAWDGRFLIPTLPPIFIYTAIGFNALVIRMGFNPSKEPQLTS